MLGRFYSATWTSSRTRATWRRHNLAPGWWCRRSQRGGSRLRPVLRRRHRNSWKFGMLPRLLVLHTPLPHRRRLHRVFDLWRRRRLNRLLQKKCLFHSLCHWNVFCFSGGKRNALLSSRGPFIAHKHHHTWSNLPKPIFYQLLSSRIQDFISANLGSIIAFKFEWLESL